MRVMNHPGDIEEYVPQRVFNYGGAIGLQPSGPRLGRAAALELMKKIEACVTARLLVSPGMTDFLVDMQNVEILDSEGLGLLVQTLQIATSAGFTMSFCRLQSPVRLILEITRLDQTFPIYDDYASFAAARQSAGTKVLAAVA